jgi:hypothetical protein
LHLRCSPTGSTLSGEWLLPAISEIDDGLHPTVYATLIAGILPGPHRRETGGASRCLAQRWLFQASAEGLEELFMQTISFILAPSISAVR